MITSCAKCARKFSYIIKGMPDCDSVRLTLITVFQGLLVQRKNIFRCQHGSTGKLRFKLQLTTYLKTFSYINLEIVKYKFANMPFYIDYYLTFYKRRDLVCYLTPISRVKQQATAKSDESQPGVRDHRLIMPGG